MFSELESAIINGDAQLVQDKLKDVRLTRNKFYDFLNIASIHDHVIVFYTLLFYHSINNFANERNGNDTLLHYAAKLTYSGPTQILLESNFVDVYAVNERNETPVHVAAKRRSYRNLDILLQQLMEKSGEFRNLVDDDGLSLFHILCMGKNYRYVNNRLLVDRDSISITDAVSSNSTMWPGFNALHFAASHYRLKTLRILVTKLNINRSILNIRTSQRLTLLHLACKMDERDLERIWAEAILEVSSDRGLRENPENEIRGKLLKTLRERDFLADLLLEKCRVDARDAQGNNALMYAMLNEWNRTIVDSYLRRNWYLFREELLEMEDTIHACKIRLVTSILQVCLNRTQIDYDMFAKDKCLEKYFNSKNNRGYTCLHHIATLPHDEPHLFIKFLIVAGADVNRLNNDNATPLHLAIVHGQANLIRLLLSCNAIWEKAVNINAQDNRGNLPIHYALLDRSELDRSINSYLPVLLNSELEIENDDGISGFFLICNHAMKIVSSVPDFAAAANCVYRSTVTLNAKTEQEVTTDRNGSFYSTVNIQFVVLVWKHLMVLKIGDCLTNCNTSILTDFIDTLTKLLLVNEQSIDDNVRFTATCQQEANELKGIRIDSYTYLMDVLTLSIDKLVRYTRNENIKMILKWANYGDFCETFPHYGEFLVRRILRAFTRRGILKEAKKSLKTLSKQDLPDPCAEGILCYFNEKQLRDFIRITKITVANENL